MLMYTLRYQAFIANPNNVNDKRIFSGQVRSMDETRRDVIAEQNCFIIGKATCKNFKNDHDTIDYKIELRNLKEEAKEESGISEDESSLSRLKWCCFRAVGRSENPGEQALLIEGPANIWPRKRFDET